ncbi:hypothetical protein CYANOKiyG1_30420 [Okeania sp. KiyG1]|nr:hypothetical protein CYANOKiyG1_30420 [Okeania sp. KiyG1]
MNKGQFDYIYRNLSKKEKEILKWYLSDKNMTQTKIANLTNYDQGNISKKLRAIAKKFNYSESSLDWKEYLVNIFGKFQPNMVDQELLKYYGCHQVFMPDGPEKLDSPFYIERHRIKRCSVESECYEEIEKPSSLVRIKAPNQMGKTSLIKRIQDKANHSNYIPIYLRFDNSD